jgi:hypothetical protein
MSKQRCWDCLYGKRYGRGERNGKPQAAVSFVECHGPRPFWVTSTTWHCRHDAGENCKCFSPRKEQP